MPAEPRVLIISSQEGSRTFFFLKLRVIDLNGGHVPQPCSQKVLRYCYSQPPFGGSDLCQKHFPGRFGDLGGLQDQAAEGHVSMEVTGLPRHHRLATQRSADHKDEAEKSKETGGVSVSFSRSHRSPGGPDLGVVMHIPTTTPAAQVPHWPWVLGLR